LTLTQFIPKTTYPFDAGQSPRRIPAIILAVAGRSIAVADDTYRAEPLRVAQAKKVYALVSILLPEVTPEAWLAFVRQATHISPRRGGLIAVTDQRGYCHAIFSYRVGQDLAAGRALRVSDVIMGRLPGTTLPRAVVACAERLAADLDSATVLIDLPDSMMASGDAELLSRAGFQASGLVLTRRIAPPAPGRSA
jgi:hypothetical protein